MISIMCIVTIIFLFKFDHGHEVISKHDQQHQPHLLSYLGINKTSSDAILITVLVFSTLGIFFSSLLVVGTYKKKANHILSYFVFGIFQVFALLLGAILELIHLYWALAMAEIIIAVLYIHGLLIVHMAYESAVGDDSSREILEELIYDEEEDVQIV